MRWLVERTGGSFEDVGAPHCDIESGCLVFRDKVLSIVVIYAAGQWLTVVPNDEGDE